MSTKPVRPRDAASLILLRAGAGQCEVLMGRRPRQSRFMPGRYVFPGGTLERGDRLARPASELAADAIEFMAVAGDATRARMLAMAAVRETFEETGLLLAEPGEVSTEACASYARMAAMGVAPALARLRYLGRALTPTFVAMRFHARFFLSQDARLRGALDGNGELEDLGWVPLRDALELPIADVTEFMLEHAGRVSELNGTPLALGAPFFTLRNRSVHIRYLGGPAP